MHLLFLNPRDIIPRSDYVLKLDIDYLQSTLGDLLFARKVEGDIGLYTVPFGSCYHFRLAALEPTRLLPGLSMNILGGKYVPERHQAFSPRGKGADDWCGEKIRMWKYRCSRDYTYSDGWKSLFVHSESFRSIPVPYKKTLSKEEHNSYVQRGIVIEEYTSKKQYRLSGEVRPIHHPTRLNYWHVQADVFPAGETIAMKGGTTSWKEEVSQALVQYYLSIPVFVGPISPIDIPENYYCRE